MKRIVVGVDGSAASKQALRWAAELADDDDVIVVAHVWRLIPAGAFEVPAVDINDLEARARMVVDDAVGDVLGDMAASSDGSDPRIEVHVAMGHAGEGLIELAEGADLLVVGTRGYGGFKGLLLGSVSTYLVHHATCPIAVIPATDDDGSPTRGH